MSPWRGGGLIALLATWSCVAQVEQGTPADVAPSPRMAALLGQLEAGRDGASDGNQALVPSVACLEVTDEAVQAECWQALSAYFGYYTSGFEHRRRVFAWQHFSTQIIFVVVLILVGAGLFFAWLQFRRDAVAHAAGDNKSASQVEIGPGGVKVSSPVLGVIILTLSLAFFYLYLIYVYPIQEIL